MENVNKIQIRIDSINSSATTINIPFGLDFYPVDNTELQLEKFVKKEKEKAVNPIFDHEKYPYYPTFKQPSNNTVFNAYTVEYSIDKTLDFLGLSDDDVVFYRTPFNKTYLRLNFYDSRDTKIQKLVARETLTLRSRPDWFSNGILKPQSTIPLTFYCNFQSIMAGSSEGEGFNFYWYKNNLPNVLYVKPSIMNAKTGEVINLYSAPSFVTPIQIFSTGYNYIETNFYENLNDIQRYYYIFNNDGISNIQTLANINSLIENTITINLKTY